MLLILGKYAASHRNLARPTANHTDLSFKRQRCGTKEHDTYMETYKTAVTHNLLVDLYIYIFLTLSKFDLLALKLKAAQCQQHLHPSSNRKVHSVVHNSL